MYCAPLIVMSCQMRKLVHEINISTDTVRICNKIRFVIFYTQLRMGKVDYHQDSQTLFQPKLKTFGTCKALRIGLFNSNYCNR